jgi:hypothetical protein
MGSKLPILEMKSRLLSILQQTIVLLHKGLFPGEDSALVRQCIKVQLSIFQQLLEEWLAVPDAKDHPRFEHYTTCLKELVDMAKEAEKKPPPPDEEDKVKTRVDAANEVAEKKKRKKSEKKEAGPEATRLH